MSAAPPVAEFDKLLAALARAGVEFVVIGGVAGLAHGGARLTQDLDILYRRSDENLRRVVAALTPIGPQLRGAPPGLPFLFDEKTLKRGLNFTLQTSLGPIDLMGEIPGGTFESLIAHTVELELFGARARFLDLPSLIAVKRAAGRPKDFVAIAELEALLEERAKP